MVKRLDGLGEPPKSDTPMPGLRDAKKTDKLRKSVYIYITTLFLVVFLFTLLSYFVQQRNNSEISTLSQKNAKAQQNIENLQKTTLQLQAENSADKKQITDLQTQLTDLRKQIKEIQQQWQADVINVHNSDQAAYNILLNKYNALIESTGQGEDK